MIHSTIYVRIVHSVVLNAGLSLDSPKSHPFVRLRRILLLFLYARCVLYPAYFVVRIFVGGIKIHPRAPEVHYPQWPEVQSIHAMSYLEHSVGDAKQDYVDAVQACSQQSMYQDHTAHGHLQPATAITVPRQSVHAKKNTKGLSKHPQALRVPYNQVW